MPTGLGAPHALAFAALLAVVLGGVSDAKAGEPPFGRFDVRTVFYISKSDDHNRVDYGIHLDESGSSHLVSVRLQDVRKPAARAAAMLQAG